MTGVAIMSATGVIVHSSRNDKCLQHLDSFFVNGPVLDARAVVFESEEPSNGHDSAPVRVGQVFRKIFLVVYIRNRYSCTSSCIIM